MSRRPIFIHIGCSKSGTSSLQRALYASVPQLLAQGVGVPLPSRGEALRATYRPLETLQPGSPVPRRVRGQMTALAKRLQDAEGDRLLITLEDLSELAEANASLLVDALEDFDVHVVVTARDWSRQIPSDWQELLKQRLLLTYADFTQAVRDNRPEVARFRIRQDVPDIAQRWGAKVPPERIHIIAVPPPTPDPRRLFHLVGGVVGFDATTLVVPPGLKNMSLGYEQAETLRRVNVALGGRLTDVRKEYRPAAKVVLFEGPLRKQKGSPLRLPPEHLEWCRQICTEMLGVLEDRGYDLVGDREDLLPSADEGLGELPTVSDADVAQSAVEALADLVHAHQLQRGKRRRPGAAKGKSNQRE